VKELALVAGLTPKTLRARFANWYGTDISREACERRTGLALKLLAETDLEIEEIGRRCGFRTAPNFFNFIRRNAGGIGPAEYRRQSREGGGDREPKK
jgi:transcriptional regulator GlxA family with amidase domain